MFIYKIVKPTDLLGEDVIMTFKSREFRDEILTLLQEDGMMCYGNQSILDDNDFESIRDDIKNGVNVYKY